MSINYYGELFQGAKITPQVKRAAERTKEYAQGQIVGRSRKKTGDMIRGWKITTFGYGLSIKNPVFYTIYQEMGTKYFTGRHMVTDSMPAIKKRFKQELRMALGGDDKRANKIIGSVAKADIPKSYESLTQGGAPSLGNVGFKAK